MIINELPIIMIRCLILTILIEIIVGIILKIRDKRDLLNILFVNLITNPIVSTFPVYFNVKYGILERNIVLFILEVLAVLVEGKIYKKYLIYKKINSYILSIILNAASYFLGIIINFIIY